MTTKPGYVIAFALLAHFEFNDLPVALQDVARPFYAVAHDLAKRTFGDRKPGERVPGNAGAETTGRAAQAARGARLRAARPTCSPAMSAARRRQDRVLADLRTRLDALAADQQSLRGLVADIEGELEPLPRLTEHIKRMVAEVEAWRAQTTGQAKTGQEPDKTDPGRDPAIHGDTPPAEG